jgi:hypothetical protein
MAVTFLKKAKDLQPKRTAKFFLHHHLAGFDKARSMKVLHSSELTKPEGFCPRSYALHDATGIKPKDRWLSTSEQVTFQMGRDLEHNVVNWFGDTGRSVCHWKCLACGTMHMFQLRPSVCAQCNSTRFDPNEARFESAITGASCGVDMLLALGGGKYVVHELKTIDKEEFKALVAPLAEHRLRTNFYLRIVGESASPWAAQVDSSRAYILYVSKGGYGCADPGLKQSGIKEQFSPFKEFEIARNDAQTEDLARRAKVVKDYRAGAVGMPCGICPSALTKRAAQCTWKNACFGGEHPPVYQWSKD